MSQTIVSVLIQLLTIGLPMIGVNAGSEQLTTTIQTVIMVATGLYIWYRRTQVGDVNAAGLRK